MKDFTSYSVPLAQFFRDEDGAVTVDYVVGAAAGVLLSVTIMQLVGGSTKTFADDTGTVVETRVVGDF
ncbi:Flp family type IVb pilin [Algirhabdus cladophorae]|uniref:Flp family type IVb pilin n=1 Tax=Algirhabdus cladophorae TaxID=3377108 RepID=UPI003B84938D